MRLLPDAAHLQPEALARRWFSYIFAAVCTLIIAVSLLMATTSGPSPTSHSQSRVGEVDPRAR